MKSKLALATLFALCAPFAQAAMVVKNLDYDVGGKKMQSALVYDDAVKTARPGIVMTPDWKGMNVDQIALAKSIAGRDYVILVADVYGTDVRPKTDEEATTAIKPLLGDRAMMRTRINAALSQLKAQTGKAPLDGKHYGAIGFCFGGATTLDLARSGADVQGFVTFHGNLSTDDPALAKNIKGKVLVLNGADDRGVSPDKIAAFEKEMNEANVDWQFHNYSGTVHCFAVPVSHNPPGCVYNEKTAKRAFAAMHALFDEAFAEK